MFRAKQQRGFIPILQSYGARPLELWEMKVQNGSIRRVTDEHVRALALELAGTNVSTCLAYCPRDPKASLGINMPFLVMIVKNLKKYFTFEVTILDDTNAHRRFRLSNFQKVISIQYFSTSMPLCLNSGWNEIFFDLSEFTRKAYKTRYVETTRIQIHANCRLRVVYFCDKLYKDENIPKNLKIFLPISTASKKKDEGKDKLTPENLSRTTYEYEDENTYSGRLSTSENVDIVDKKSQVKFPDHSENSGIISEGGESVIGSEGYKIKLDKQGEESLGSERTIRDEPEDQKSQEDVLQATGEEETEEPVPEVHAHEEAEKEPAEGEAVIEEG